MSYQWPAGSKLRPKNTEKSEKGVNLTPGKRSGTEFRAYVDCNLVCIDPCGTVSVLLWVRLDQGFNLSYQLPSESVLGLETKKKGCI